MQQRFEAKRASYDDIAPEYDQHWSVHVREPQQRLTRELGLERGLRCADLGCGTGLDTVEMLRTVSPGEVLAVDCSPQMLETARGHARAASLSLSTQCSDATEFITSSEPARFDVVTLRFCLGYLDWRSMLPRMPRLVRPRGRVGLLTILGTSAPQAYAVYEELAATVGLSTVMRAGPTTPEEIHEGLRAGGADVLSSWTHSFRLTFEDGTRLSRFLRVSGIASHPLLDQLAPSLAEPLWRGFSSLLDARYPHGEIPLDFHLAGVVASGAA
ncbi:MAG TPA: methyltransferase domain-containing protein [Polyangiales bacterium]